MKRKFTQKISLVSIKKPKKACTLKIKVVVREKLSHKKQKHLFFKEM